jgi:uncharacterized membrane protein YhaH (DUF805 family)
MSINTLAFEAAARTKVSIKLGPTRGVEERVAVRAGEAPPPLPETPPNNILANLTKYIPTESVTLYVATVSAQGVLKNYGFTPSCVYMFFVYLTPLLLLILFLQHLAIAKKNWKISPREWPWWKMVASTIAFAGWALAIPGNPVFSPDSATGGVIAGLIALFVSTFLSIFDPFFDK